MILIKLYRAVKSYIRILTIKALYGKKIKFAGVLNTYIDSNVNIELNSKSSEIYIGSSVRMRRFCTLKCTNGTIKIGNNVFLNNYISLNCREYIEIGDDCLLGENIKVYDHDHTYKLGEKTRDLPIISKKIMIGNNVWIGANVIILKGVTIGDNVVIAAGSLINKDVPSNTIAYNRKEEVIKDI